MKTTPDSDIKQAIRLRSKGERMAFGWDFYETQIIMRRVVSNSWFSAVVPFEARFTRRTIAPGLWRAVREMGG